MLNLTHQYLIDWSTTISMFVVIIMFLFLFESRYPKKKYFASLIPFSICWFGLNLGILFICGIEVQGTYSLLTATLPSREVDVMNFSLVSLLVTFAILKTHF